MAVLLASMTGYPYSRFFWSVMMAITSPFVVFEMNCAEAVFWATQKLEQAGFQAVRTFDLKAARLAHLNCACPNHGTTACTCQMVVLLVYQGNNPPATMVIHGYDEISSFFLVNTPQQPVQPDLEKNIQQVFGLELI